MDSRIPEILRAVDSGRALTHQEAQALAEALAEALELATVQFGQVLARLVTAQDDLARIIEERNEAREAREALYRARRDVAGT